MTKPPPPQQKLRAWKGFCLSDFEMVPLFRGILGVKISIHSFQTIVSPYKVGPITIKHLDGSYS